MEIKIGLIGCGTVGRGLLEILERKRAYLKDAFHFEARLVAISDKLKGSLLIPDGIDIAKVLVLLEAGRRIDEYPDKPEPAQPVDPLDMIEKTNADVIAELTYTNIETAEPATGYIKKCFRSGHHVVTSNKGPAALHYKELRALAETNGLLFRIEGTVMSGTPVFSLVESGLAGTEIREVKGILNGTTNFILSKMEQDGMEYADALRLAQKLGYAEADPTADVEGLDAVNKLVILARLAFGAWIDPDAVSNRPGSTSGRPGAPGITAVTAEDVAALAAEGRILRLIATTRLAEDGAIEASVVPTAVPAGSPFGRCDGVLNRVEVDATPVGSVAFEGPGAGGPAAAAAVLSDLVSIARGVGSTWAGSPAATVRSGIPVRPVAGECIAAPSGACYPVGD